MKLVYSKPKIDQFIKDYFIEIDEITKNEIVNLFELIWSEQGFRFASYVVRTKFNYLLKK
jgi:hypothetical protein